MATLRLVLVYFRHNLMSAMAYRFAFLLQVFGMLLNDVMLLFFWTVLFQQFPSLNGWTLEGVITIYAVVAAGYGLAVVACGNAPRLPELIAAGSLDYYLVLPANPLVHVLVSRMALPGWGDLIFGVLVYLLSGGFRWQMFPLFLLLIGCVAIVFVSFGVISGSLAFWIGRSENVSIQLWNALLSFSLYPIDVFPGIVRLLLYTALPAALIGSLPAALLLKFDWLKLGAVVAVAALFAFLAAWVFRRGLRRYESGNLVAVQG